MTASPEPAAHDEQLHAIIAEYHRRLDRGEAPDRAAFIAAHGEFQAELESYFQSVDSVERLAGPALQTAHAGDATEGTLLTEPGRAIEEIVATPASDQSPVDSAVKSDTQSVVAGETIITTMDEGTVSAISGLSGGKAAAPLQRFGRYRIVKELGRGAMGAVYLAHDEQLDREVALKIPQFGQDLNRGLLERFYREARAAAALRHPGICPVYDVGEIDGQHYITMAYIKGRALRDFTKSSRRQDGKQVARVIRKIALAMEEAHEHNVIHRDLKPANVMIDLKNEPVVMDFGLARRAAEGEERLTHTGTIIGTPAYMSPEQVDGGNDNVGARSDIYSLGVIFYELLTGQLPFQGNLMSILRQIATAEPRPPVELFPDIDPALQSLCLKMLAKKAADRPTSMTEVAQVLTDWLSGRHAPTDESGLLETSRVPGQSRKQAAGEVTEPMTPAGSDRAELAAEEFPAAGEMSVTRQRPRSTARRGGPPSSRKWLLFGSLGGAALLLTGIVFFLKLGKHDVQITLDDPAMSLKVDGDAVIIDGNGSPIRLSAGSHQLRVEMAGFESEVAQFSVKKDGKNAVHVAIVNGKLAVIPDGKVPAIDQTERSASGSSNTASSKWHSTMEGHGALAFDGVDDHVILPPLPWNGGALTIEALVQAGAQAFPNGMVIAINSERGLALLSFDTDGVPVFGRMEKETLQSTLDPASREVAQTRPVHIAAVLDGETTSLFLNGRLASRGASVTYTPRGRYEPQTTIGAILQGAGAEKAPMNFLKGVIHEIRVSSGARYTRDFEMTAALQPDAETIALYHFDEGTGEILRDSSGHNRHGRIVGAKWVRTEGGSLTPGETAAPSPAIAPFDEAAAKTHQQAWADYLGIPVEYTNSIGMKFRLIPPGEFLMGSTPEEIEAALKVAIDDEILRERINSEAPRHQVVLTQPIYVGVHEVTQSQYEQVMGTNPSHFSITGAGKDAVAGLETGNHPVEMVSWNDAAEFCARLSQQEQLKPFYFRAGDAVTPLDGTGYRLLTEAEWEFACRAGTTTRFWSGDEDHDLVSVGWFGGNSGGRTHTAGELKANPFGLWDIHGNVREWVEDSMDHAFYGKLNKDAATNPSSPFSSGFRRVIRDGNWQYDPPTCRSSRRYAHHSSYSHNHIGFRVVLVVESVKQQLSQKATTPPASKATDWPADAPPPAITPFDAAQAKAHQQAWARHLGTTVETTNSVGAKMILIPPGEFMMGNSDADIEQLTTIVKERNDGNKKWIPEHARKNSTPQHRVTLTKPYLLAATEVTVAQFRRFVEESKYQTDAERYGFGNSGLTRLDDSRVDPKSKGLDWRNPGYAVADDQPVSQVTPKDAEAYCEWLSRKEGALYALPTEAEWEFACRAGTTTPHYFGADDSRYAAYEWCHTNARGRPQPVATKLPNPFGLFDMSGNLEEYCADIYDSPVYASRPASVIDPVVTGPGTTRTQRGQSWLHVPYELRSASRFGGGGTNRYHGCGFRVARRWNMVPPAAESPFDAKQARAHQEAWARHLGTAPAAVAAPLPTNKTLADPAFQQWLVATQKLPAEQQLAEVSKKLMELNPGFDGKLWDAKAYPKPLIENGIVTGLGFDTAKVADISPVRVFFSGLRDLYCRANPRPNGHGPRGLLIDLSPLAGMHLTSLTAANSPIVDLSPLRGMQLKSLGIYTTDVSDLTPLVGMPLEVLGMNYAQKVTDLRPLRGMPLKDLTMNGLPIADLSPLVGMKLDGLSIASTQVADLAVLRGMPLRWIDLSGTKVTDLAPLRDCVKLETVLLSRVNIAPAEISKLLEALPDCKVEFSTPSGLLPETDALQEVDPERRVARWVLARGGTVRVSRASDERSRTIALEKDLPAEPFLVVDLKVPGSSNEISAAEWQSLGNLRFVRLIDVSGCRPTNEALAAIGRCRSLENLILAFHPSFNDIGLQHLVDLPHLRTLDIGGAGQTAASLELLGKLTSLRVLKMGTKDLQVTTLKPLQSLVHLHQMDLNGAIISDQAVGELAALPQLRNLNLANSGLTPAVIDQLLKLRGLYAVSIEGLRLPAGALLKLADHPTLSLINTYGSGIKPEEYEQLAKALPRLTFLHPELQTLNAAELAAIDWAATVATVSGYDRQLREKASHNPELTLNFTKAIPAAEFQQLGKVKNVTSVILSIHNSSDEHMQVLLDSLREFPHLLYLNFDKAQFTTSTAFASLPKHAGLWSFALMNSDGVNDASLAPLAKLPHLARVKLESSQLTDGMFEHLKPLQELEILSVLRAQQVTGNRLSELRDKPRLWNLQLSKTGVTDAALAALVDWPALEELSLDRTAISDAGLTHLAGCKNLRVLNVYGTKVTPAGIAALRKALPGCMVLHDSGISPPAAAEAK